MQSNSNDASLGAPPGRSLRRLLFWLAALAILPLALMAGLGLSALVLDQRRQAEQAAVDVTRALATAVDAELRLSWSALEALATAAALESGDLPTFYEHARRVVAQRPEWSAVLLAEPSGKVLLSTDRPLGEALLPVAEPESFAATLERRRPTIGYIGRGRNGAFRVPIRIPVIEGGRPRFVLTAVLKPEAIAAVIAQQRLPRGSIISVFDAKGLRVARSRLHAESMGTPASPTLQALMHEKPLQGQGVTDALEGDAVFSAYLRSPLTGWTVATGVPLGLINDGPVDALTAFGGGIVLSILIGGLAAFGVARHITAHIGSLREAALAFGHGEPLRLSPSDIREVRELGDVLLGSAQRRARAEAEREQLLHAERQARDTADAARRRLELLASAGSALSHSLEARSTLQTIAASIVPGIADWCRVDLLDAHGELQRALTHHADPERARRAEALVRDLRVAHGTRGSMSSVVESGESCLVQLHTPQPDHDPALLEFAAAIGMHAYYIVPLRARGRTLGALAALQAESGRGFDAADCALVSDLASRAAMALDNARLLANAEAAAQKAEAANRAKDEFLAVLGHELRNPLAPIATALGLMALRQGGQVPKEQRIIQRQVNHLQRLVDDLLDVSRITEGKIQLAHELLDMKAVLGHAVELTQPLFERRERALEIELPDAPALVVGDAVRLAQVVGNLLNNAAKFTPPQGRIALRLARAGAWVEIVVEDDGIGMAAGLLPQVFELFVQGQQAMDRRAGGLGLGLAIVKGLVQMHGGSVDAESAGIGRGSRFRVRLPAADAPLPGGDTTAPATALRRGAGRVLVVDDNADAAEMLEVLLSEVGYEVRTALDAASALRLCETFTPDVALLDIGLPGISGYELAETLRRGPLGPRLRLVALTGYGSEKDRAQALACGFDEHLVKPVAIEALLALLERLARTSEQPAA